MKTERFVLGTLGGPSGLRGQIKFRPWSGESAHVLRLREAVLRRPAGRDGGGEDGGITETSPAERRLKIENAVLSGVNVLLKFAGVDSPEAARILGGMELVAERGEAAELGPGEWYVEDLRGIAVAALPEGGPAAPEDGRLEVLGTVTDIIEGGGGQLLELRLAGEYGAGSGDGTRLVPFRDEFFGEPSLEAGRIVLLHRWVLE